MNLTTEQKEKVETLLSQMTLTEKLGQMNQVSVSIVGSFDVSFEELIEMLTDGRISQEEFGKLMAGARKDYHKDDIRAGKVGALMVDDPVEYNRLQKIAVEETRLGIPIINGRDIIHGCLSIFPIAIAEAGSFDPELFEETAAMAAREARSQGISWFYSPMVDVARDARWGRVSEGPGEDPCLASVFASAKIRGLQDHRESTETYVAACMKHFAAYGAVEGGRDYNTTNMSLSRLYNVYLPPFKAGIEAGAASIMASFNDLNGVPNTVNPFLLRNILKDDWKFPGFVVSDANAIRECVSHGIARDETDAGVQAVNAGMDMDMGTEIFNKDLPAAIEKGLVSMDTIDEAVRRILSVKVWLGLFEHPYLTDGEIHRYDVLPEEHRALCLRAAQESIVLLRNKDHLLPLSKKTRISLVGALAADADETTGAWAISYRSGDLTSIKDAFAEYGVSMSYHAVCGPESDINEEELEAVLHEDSDVIVAVVGEAKSMSGEASSRADITLPGRQREMLEKLLTCGKPVIAILMNGRPLALSWEDEHLDAIIEGWHLGIGMGEALAQVLFGEINPSGKLSSTFPRMSGQCPVYYAHTNTGRPGGRSKFTSKYMDAGYKPLYPFGYGLSYTEFACENLAVTQTRDALQVSVDVSNTGDREGAVTVQLYMRDVTASLVRPVKELKGFQRVDLQPGEKRSLSFTLWKRDMGFYNNEGKYLTEDGAFQIFAGTSSEDCLMDEVEVTF